MLSNKRHFAYNLITSYGNTIISSVLAFVSVPIALNYWGSELYGIWTILTSFSIYIMASGLGIDSATGNLMTKNADFSVKISILKKGVKLLICCSIVTVVILSILTIVFPNWFRIIGKMEEINYPVAKISALIYISGIIISLPLNAISNSLASFGKAYIATIIGTLQIIIAFFIIIITISLELSLPFYVFLIQINTILCGLIKLVVVCFTIKKESANLSHNSGTVVNSEDDHYKTILKMGLNMFLYGLALLLVPNISNLIISNNIDIKSLVPYSLSYKLFSTAIVFVTNANIALSPLLGKEYGEGNWDWLQKTYKKMFCSTITISLFLVLGVIWLSKTFIKLWTGSVENYAGSLISILLGFYFFLGALSNVNHVIINTFNYTNKVWLISWSDGSVFLLLSIILIKFLGVVSVPLGLCCGACFVSSWAYPMLVYKRTGKKFRYNFLYLAKNLLVFMISIIAFLSISELQISFVMQIILEVIGMTMTTIMLFFSSPKEFRKRIIEFITKKIG